MPESCLLRKHPAGRRICRAFPFVGPAGRMFDQLLESVSLSRDEIYITNIIKCNPPFNRDPSEEEKAACIPYLKYETLLIQPKIMVCLGGWPLSGSSGRISASLGNTVCGQRERATGSPPCFILPPFFGIRRKSKKPGQIFSASGRKPKS